MARTATRIGILSFAVCFIACSGGDDGDNVEIDNFTAMPTMVNAGGKTNIVWSTVNATNITIVASPGGGLVDTADANGTIESAALTETTTFTLTAIGPGGPAIRTVMVTVRGNNDLPMVNSFVATPSTISIGSTTTLMWTTANAETVSITAGGNSVLANGPTNSNLTVMPTVDTTYELTATGPNGTATATLMVTVTPNPIITSFIATPNTIALGDSASIAWVVVNADNVTVTNSANVEVFNGSDLNGSATVTPDATQTYTLVATNGMGSATMTAMVTVNPPVGLTINVFSASPMTIGLGEQSTLTWDVANATSITIDDGAGSSTTSTDLTGAWTVRPLANTTYTLTATDGNSPDVTAQLTIMVNAAAPAVIDFSAAPNPGPLEGQTTIRFDLLGADDVRVLREGTQIYAGTSNTDTLTANLPLRSNVFTLEATNALGTTTVMLAVDAQATPVINNFTVAPQTFLGSVTATLSWDVSSTVRLELFVDGVRDAGFAGVGTGTIAVDATGTHVVGLNATTAFRLVATSAGGTAELTIGASLLVPETEPNDDLTTATPLVGNSVVVRGMIAGVGDVDWYAITVPAGYSVRAETSDGMGGCSMDTTLTLTATNSIDAADRLAFDDDSGPGACSRIEPTSISANRATNLAAGTYNLVVQEFGSNDTGDYVLSVELIAPACGDAIVSGGETCDDGNNTSNDGCDAMCALEITDVYTAPGLPTTFTATVTAGVRGAFQITATNDVYIFAETFSNAAAGECAGPLDTDIYLIDATGGLLATDDFDGIADCSLLTPVRDPAVRVTAGTYYLVVEDEGNDTAISYHLLLEGRVVDVCGNGIVDAQETCDDGNTIASDGCDAVCQIEPFIATPGATRTYAQNSLAVGAVDVYAISVPVGNDVYLRAETFSDAAAGTCSIDSVIRLNDGLAMELGQNDEGGVNSCSRIDPATDAFARLAGGASYAVTVEDYLLDNAISRYDIVFDGVAVDICGNGVLETTENCDDGNTMDGDSCPANCVIANLVTGTSMPAATIPDNNATGIMDTIVIPAVPACTILNVTMDIDITHTFRGDIELDLTSPQGTTVRVKNSAFDSADDLIGNYPNSLTPANPLSFTGSANGMWTLDVVDAFSGDIGTLNRWGLSIGCQ